MKTSRVRTVSTFLLLTLGIAAISVRTASADLPFPANYYESQPLWSCTYSTHNWDWEPEPVRYEPDNGSGFVARNVTLSACWEAISDAIIRNEQRRPTGTVSVVSQGPDTAECVSISFPVSPPTQFRCFAAYGVIMDIRYSHGVVEHVWRRGSAFAIVGVPQNYIIRLSPAFGSAESGAVLTSIEPDKSTNLITKVYDQNNQLVPNVGVKLALETKQNSGGHHHPDDTVAVRTGTMNGQQIFTDNTGPNGLQFSYKAPSVAGDYKITASCIDGKNCQPEGPDTVWVGYKGLQPIIPASDSASGPLYVLIGQKPEHPNNHYLTPLAMGRLQQLAALYRQRFPSDPPLHFNDASLERGGLFDIYYDYVDKYGVRHERNAEGWWTTPHAEHRKGMVIDIRANDAEGTIPPSNRARFVELVFLINGYVGQPHSKGTSNQHYHVCLMGVCE